MAGPYTPSDTLIGNLTHQIALTVKNQIPSIGYVWEETPDRPPADNTVTINLQRARVLNDTNGKLYVAIDYGITHVFGRAESADSIARAYTYVVPWLRMLNAWTNQSLGGNAISVDTNDVVVGKVVQSGQVRMAVITRICVYTEFNIDLT